MCATARGQSFCSESTTPSPRCDGAPEATTPIGGFWSTVCSEGRPVTCFGGFAQLLPLCASGTECVSTHLEDGTPASTCALSSTPDPSCPARGQGYCDGLTLVACELGFDVDRTPCPNSCIVTSDFGPGCK
jgi:hypothetical protein